MEEDERCGTCTFWRPNKTCKESNGKTRGENDWCAAWGWNRKKPKPKEPDRPMIPPVPELDMSYLKKKNGDFKDMPKHGPLSLEKVKCPEADEEWEILHINGRRIDPEILEFVDEMQRIFNERKAHRGESWRTLPMSVLRIKLMDKIKKMNDVLLKDVFGKTNHEGLLMINIANYCWMIWQRRKGGDI